jgi:hypothetical protein
MTTATIIGVIVHSVTTSSSTSSDDIFKFDLNGRPTATARPAESTAPKGLFSIAPLLADDNSNHLTSFYGQNAIHIGAIASDS